MVDIYWACFCFLKVLVSNENVNKSRKETKILQTVSIDSSEYNTV